MSKLNCFYFLFSSGVLLKGDRIVRINEESTMDLTLEEFSNLIKEAFTRDEVTLIVNFDVALPEVKFGTFDIHFDKTLKPGLEFKGKMLEKSLMVEFCST